MLVAKHWVQSVEVGFLLPGHGHGLQDQLFSSLHVPLHTQDALTVPAFLQRCEYAYQHKPITLFVLDVVWDWRGYFSPFLQGYQWQCLEDCFGFLISIGVPSAASQGPGETSFYCSYPLVYYYVATKYVLWHGAKTDTFTKAYIKTSAT
ncbi:hypothetical protein Pelo_18231 [Pelomyxa schiedti]|nr:hypothetical protein Pelo_18231 [Pelomyxa schiedti]